MEHSVSPLEPIKAEFSEIPERSRQINMKESGTLKSTTSTESHKSVWSSVFSRASRPSSSSQTSRHPKQSASRCSRWTSEWITDWWGMEIVCWVLAVLSLIAIVIALESHKNQPIPEWSFGITLNSLISIFATIGQMAMMKPIVECISQLKWLWFVRKEKLSGFQDFDDASRGPTGSLLLLGKLRGMHLVTLGATITIVSAAFGPFAQQVVTYPLRLHEVGIASTPQVFNYTGAGDNGGTSSPAEIASIFEGFALGNSNLSTVIPSCSTGNCTWSEYTSLGVCASVEDISSSIINNTCNATAFEETWQAAGLTNPGYPCFNYTLTEQTMYAAEAGPGAHISNATLTNTRPGDVYGLGFAQVLMLSTTVTKTSSISTTYLMYQPDFLTSINSSSLPSPLAYVLHLDFCVQRYNTSVLNGVVNTTALSSQILQTNLSEAFTPDNSSFSIWGNSAYVPIDGSVFGVSYQSIEALATEMQSVVLAFCYQIPTFVNPGTPTLCSGDAGDPFLEAFMNSSDLLSTITGIWNKLAISMTNTFRTGDDGTGAGGNTQVGQFKGKALAPIAFVDSNYLWLILPIGLVALTLVFLLATILKSQRLGSRVWKSSNFATLQGLHGDLHTSLGGLSSISNMEKKAKEVEVRFDFDMKGGNAERCVKYRLVEPKQEPYWMA